MIINYPSCELVPSPASSVAAVKGMHDEVSIMIKIFAGKFSSNFYRGFSIFVGRDFMVIFIGVLLFWYGEV